MSKMPDQNLTPFVSSLSLHHLLLGKHFAPVCFHHAIKPLYMILHEVSCLLELFLFVRLDDAAKIFKYFFGDSPLLG
ncbi:MAG: hypothetical protein QME83_13575 [Thermodesulfobacteriota bacterium]|nr:hypothetical protein [Thermodesulfobacteriota bacterium]